jgi:hypothetical protein
MRHKVKTRPIRVHAYNAELDCHTSRIVAYRYACSCGERGSGRASFRQARQEGATHRHEARL